MDIATTIVLIAVLLMVVAYLLQPFFTGGGDRADSTHGAGLDTVQQRAALLAERNRIYSEIHTLDFDYSTNKIADEDYQEQRHGLVAEGVAVLKQIDALPPAGDTPAHDPIEAAVLALRSGQGMPVAVRGSGGGRNARGGKAKGKQKASGRTSFCPHCGKPVVQGDLFCASCGNRL